MFTCISKPENLIHSNLKMKIASKALIVFSFITLFLTQRGFAQAQWEVDFVRRINLQYADKTTWNTLSSTVAPISIAFPLGLFAVSMVNKDKRLRNRAYEAVAGIAFTAASMSILKAIVKRPRPYYTYSGIYPVEYDNSYSFPSGHTSLAFATATSIAMTAKKWYFVVPAFAWASGVGYSRIGVGQHYPSDVIAGAFVGVTCAYVSHVLNKKLFSVKKKQKIEVK